MDWVPPDSFDEYRLIKRLGRGSMGQVWLAHDTVLDRPVAVKFLAALAGHDATHQRFLIEARAAARVQHPNIVAIYRVGEIGPRPYLISEYVCGDNLDKLVRPVAWPRLLELATGLARGLAAAHRQGVLHRDLKPANAIVSEAGEVKLRNFGLVKLLPQVAPPPAEASPGDEAPLPGDPTIPPPANRGSFTLPLARPPGTAEPPGVPASVLVGGVALPEPPAPHPRTAPWPSITGVNTDAGAVMGTPAYMPPEAWRGEPATPRSDVYSLGALLYELSTGALYRAESPDTLWGSAVAAGIDLGFAAIVDRCLRRDPTERFSSGHEVREALEALAASGDTAERESPRSAYEHTDPQDDPISEIISEVGSVVVALVSGDVMRETLAALVAAPRACYRGLVRPLWERTRSRWVVLASAALAFALAGFAYHLFGGAHADEPGGCPDGMVRVPAGSFRMGSLEGEGDPNEQPQHEVTLSAYCIDTTEVTVAAYAACVAAGACRVALRTVNWNKYSVENVKIYSRWCNQEDRPDHPINCVDWDQAVAYCTWKGKRLPTEAEWEYAARGSDGRVYPWGKEAPSAKRLNVCDRECEAMTKRQWPAMYDASDGWGSTAPVGSYPEGTSPFGALDMAGNVWEWTADWYGPYATQAETNPQGPRTGTSRVFRGAGWCSYVANKARTAFRVWNPPTVRDVDLGFRCARGD